MAAHKKKTARHDMINRDIVLISFSVPDQRHALFCGH
jgi:hypothetical protein